MCLIFVHYQKAPIQRLLVLANRDEFHARPTQPAHVWEGSRPRIYAGRDLQAGGTWLGVTETGRFAAVTNYREPQPDTPPPLSRGALTTEFLQSTSSVQEHANALDPQAYGGFGLLLFDGQDLLYTSNRAEPSILIPPGLHALSNHVLDTPWPKVQRGKAAIKKRWPDHPDANALLDTMLDRTLAPDEELPQTGVSLEWERRLSPLFVLSEDYGTRNSTLVSLQAGKVTQFIERNFDAQGVCISQLQLAP